MRFYLIGYMGCGKSTIGSLLSEINGIPFIDTDEVIELAAGLTIPGYFEKYGEEEFRIKEGEVLRSTLLHQKAIVATGGGMPCFYDYMSWMNQHGETIYLQLTAEQLFHRLKQETSKRPMLKGLEEKELLVHIAKQLEEREKYYLQATRIIQCAESTPHQIAVTILSR